MATTDKPLLIKRYASRRLYNTETSDYVTLEDIAGFVRAGREVQIIDLKTGDDLTRQYLLQIVAEHESKGENVLPVDVLTDLVRSYASGVQSVVPQFLASSFEMLRNNQSKMMENLTHLPNPMATVPGFEALRKQQEAFLKSMMGGMPGWTGSGPRRRDQGGRQARRQAPTTWPRSRSSWPSCSRNSPSSDPWPTAEGRVTLWGIEVFLAAAEEGAISAAARRLGVSPSAVSQQLTGLEAALGTALLDRSARPLRITPAGAMFRRHAQTILNAADEAKAELALADLAGLTTLRLGMIEDFEADVTPRLLSALSADLKGCRFQLETGPSHRLLDLSGNAARWTSWWPPIPAICRPRMATGARFTRSCANPFWPSARAARRPRICR